MTRLGLLWRAVLVVVTGLAASACTAAGPSSEEASPRVAAVVRVLPQPTLDGAVSLERALATRRSVRDFTDRAPSSEQVGQLLWAAQGVTAAWGGRTVPSAGGLYPLEVYALVRGEVWHYRPEGHRVEVWSDPGSRARLVGAVNQDAVADAPLLVVLTGVPDRLREKYGERAERYVLLEVGHAAQNVVLQAAALDLGAVTIGAFDDEAVRTALGLPAGELPYYLIPVGTPATTGR